ncbi:hypothetical protein BDP27DRAFT_1403472 [Rhodocollybia butyracea]|uniref:Uncharacterized protein n=1 Tax=Rhodocollybia butyracea TaxID=206335 RepID=A0A9P5PLJ9_9AGAR|nr:hypothetical protein BDP27DRAFT_1403472 [Rhodocollybia butyracea]
MATVPVDAQQDELATTDNVASESELSQNLEQSPSNVDKEPAQDDDSRSLRIYSRPQLLALSKSPLVCVPPDMPELKEWFGAENEQNLSKKDSEPTTPNSGRERRFRRDADEAELPARPSFRSSLSQPSQMGNFKHQSLRTNDRDTDREGQERLRNLSDKFDRDRLGLPLSGLRTKERSIAPHLASGSTRISSQTQGTIATRRAETRETTKKKVGESSEDWRRGTEPRKADRNDRGDREERPRSRSRHRRDPSATRRDREGKEREKEREDYRRERDRDEDDDPRRWRDDGRRDERVTTRRERNNGKDKDSASSNPSDRRWTVVEDRDARSKRNTGRDKKSLAEETRTDERRGEREKEKEPAWMDTYVPSSSSGGILGGKGDDGELDGIQAWKKNMKEKEQKANKTATPMASAGDAVNAHSKPVEAGEPLNEIQQFKKLMEMAQKQSPDSPMIIGPILGPTDASKSTTTRDNDPTSNGPDAPTAHLTSDISSVPDPSRSLLSLLTANTNTDSASHSPVIDSTVPKLHSRLPITDSLVDRNTDTTFNPPQGSRLLALGNRAPAKPVTPNSQLISSTPPNGNPTTSQSQLIGFTNLSNPNLMTENSKVAPRTPSGFSPFEEQNRELGDSLRRGERTSYVAELGGTWPDSSPFDSATAGHAAGRGSRFAKFFDGKGKETPISPPNLPKAPTPVGFVSSSPGPHVRPESGFSNMSNPNLEQHRPTDELFAKLNMNSLQGQRTVQGPHPTSINHALFGQQQAQSQLHSLQQQHQQQLQNQLHAARPEPLYESRNFMPDNLVPGLRSVPPPRNRDNGGMFAADPLDDALLLTSQQRLPVQHRAAEQMYTGSLPAATFSQQQQLARSTGIPIQGGHFRGGPSPVSQAAQQHILHNSQQQRLPPGLANLGGRPPHDPAQFGLPGPIHNGLHINGPPQQQQQFSNFHPNNGFGVPQGPLRPPTHLQNSVNHHQLANLGHPATLDSRSATQHAQLLAMSGLGAGGGMRNVSGGGFNHQSGASLPNPMLALRQQTQQQPQIHPQMLPHHLPPHLQQGPPAPTNQTTSAQDLMALLMGTHRE